jgi:DNA primase
MGRIAEISIQQVIAACDIVDVISTYFPLKRAGTSFKANCPFHNEKSPSFHVNPSRGTYHCFGCGEGGNAIGFVMKYESLPFIDTVRKLAAKYGITLIEEAGTPEQEAAAGRRVKLLALHREIAQWFHQLLLKSPLAADARAYLKARGLTSDTARNWTIGYAPDDQGYYHDFAKEKKFADDLMIEAGISPCAMKTTRDAASTPASVIASCSPSGTITATPSPSVDAFFAARIPRRNT